MNLIFFNALILLIGFELNVSITLLKAKKLTELGGTETDEMYKQAI